MRFAPEDYPLILPSYRRRGRDILFLNGSRPIAQIAPEQCKLFDALDGKHPRRNLRARFAFADSTVGEWVRLGWAVLLPARGRGQSPGPETVIVEPHADDAALSLGALLTRRARRNRTTILTIVGRSNFSVRTLRGQSAPDEKLISKIRRREAQIFARMMGALSVVKNYADAPLRFSPGRRWTAARLPEFSRKYPAWTAYGPTDGELRRVETLLRRALGGRAVKELWLPLGIGHHPDHTLVREAGVRMLARTPEAFRGIKVRFYAEMPYALRHPAHRRRVVAAIRATGARLREHRAPLGGERRKKLAALAVYRSQFRAAAIPEALRPEIYYSLAGNLAWPPPRELDPHAGELRRAAEKFARWRRQSARVKRLIIFSDSTTDDFRTLRRELAAIFSGAEIALHRAPTPGRVRRALAEPGTRIILAVLPASGRRTRFRSARCLEVPWLGSFVRHCVRN